MSVTSARLSIDDAAFLAAAFGHTAEVLEYGTSGFPTAFITCAYALPRPVTRYRIHPAVLLLSTHEDLAPPKSPSKRRKSKGKREIPEAPHTPPRSPEPTDDEPNMSGNVKEYVGLRRATPLLIVA